MKLCTVFNGRPDGLLVVVSDDLTHCVPADGVAPTLQAALEHWSEAEPGLRQLAHDLKQGRGSNLHPFDPAQTLAPLPRAWQWLDGSAYTSHGDLMSTVFGTERHTDEARPLMYQGLSHQFLPATADVRLPSDQDGVDFEGEFGVITDHVPMGVSRNEAAAHIRLVVMINDWSLRRIAPIEMKTGFGWVQAKPACSMAPIALTPDELGDAWAQCRPHLRLEVDWNGARFGAPHGGAMGFGFDDLVAHAAYSRDLVAGTVIGSGTVSNANYRQVGSTCIAERRAIEMLDHGAASTPYLSFGDRVRFNARFDDGQPVPFGEINQCVLPARSR
jgi:fumarylacetoacetate (FAA) hydrolase